MSLPTTVLTAELKWMTNREDWLVSELKGIKEYDR